MGALHVCVPPLLYACTRVSGSVWVPQSMNAQWAVCKPADEACLGIRGQQVMGVIKRGNSFPRHHADLSGVSVAGATGGRAR